MPLSGRLPEFKLLPVTGDSRGQRPYRRVWAMICLQASTEGEAQEDNWSTNDTLTTGGLSDGTNMTPLNRTEDNLRLEKAPSVLTTLEWKGGNGPIRSVTLKLR